MNVRPKTLVTIVVIVTLFLVTLIWTIVGTKKKNKGSSSSGPAPALPLDDRGVPPSTLLLTDEELSDLRDQVKGEDDRLFRWDATQETVEQRQNGGCAKLPEATLVLMDKQATAKSKTMAAEFLTFCITDSPKNRAEFSEQEGIHKTVVELVGSDDNDLSAMASHLIYIATFSNKKNHETFAAEGAVEALAAVVMSDKTTAAQVMWASAALQNLAASYCETEGDGRCYWDWTPDDLHVVIQNDNLPLVSDGTSVRKEMLQIDGLVDRLIELACTGPVEGRPRRVNVFPGTNAKIGRDDNDPHLVAWAATGALKNLVLEPFAKINVEPALVCMCLLKDSPDWLESSKSAGLLAHVRRGGDPCWFNKQNMCIDDNFMDHEGYNCGDYGDVTSVDECQTSDPQTGITADKACCACGAGTVLTKDEPDDEGEP